MGFMDRMAIATLPLVPRPVMRRLASRYFAGERLEDALDELARLAGVGHPGILDILGEDVEDAEDARHVRDEYLEAIRMLAKTDLDAYVSVKPTHVGLRVSEDLCHRLLHELAAACAESGRFLRVEMEDHTTTDGTLRVFERLRREFDDVGIVLQSRLLRTPDDVDAFAPGKVDVRMVKGIYLEPASIAHVDPGPIRDAFVTCCRKLFERGASVAFATHDDVLADELLVLCRELGIGRDRYEFQVLLGVRRPLWVKWREAGEKVRVYVPYGPNWRAYSTRRLRKNPEIFRHVARDLLTRRD